MSVNFRYRSALFLGVVVPFLVFGFPHVVGAENTTSLCGPIVWSTPDVPAGASNSNVLSGSTSTIYWSVPYEDRSIQTTIQSFKDPEAAQAFASGAPQRNANDHWQSEGGYGEAAVYFRETANGNQYMVQGLHGGYNFVTVSTSAIFGTMPNLWTVPLEVHTTLFDQALSMIGAKCGNTPKQAGIYLGDMERTPFTANPAADSEPSFWIEFIDPEGIEKLDFSSLSIWSEHRATDITQEFVVAFIILEAAGKTTVEATPVSLKVGFNIDFPDLRYLIGLTGWELGDVQEDTLRFEIQRLDADKTRLTASATFHLFGKAPAISLYLGEPRSGEETAPWFIEFKDGDGIEDLDWSTFRIEQVNADVAFQDWFIYYLSQLIPIGIADIQVRKDPLSDSETPSVISARFHDVPVLMDRCKLLFFPDETEVIRVSISDKLGYTATREEVVGLSGCLNTGQ